MSLLRTMFWPTHSDVATLKQQLAAVCEDRDNAYENNSNLRSALVQARNEAERMKLPRTEEGLELIALVTARRIEDLFVSCRSGRDDRLNSVQAILREVMRANLTGSTNWKGPGEPNYRQPPKEPTT